jgi:hypothetical protein
MIEIAIGHVFQMQSERQSLAKWQLFKIAIRQFSFTRNPPLPTLGPNTVNSLRLKWLVADEVLV